MFKRGQVTAFLIVGLILLFVSGLIFFLTSNYLKSESKVTESAIKNIPIELQQYSPFIESCLRLTAQQGLIVISEKSWNYNTTNNLNRHSLKYFISNNKILIPSKEDIGVQLSRYIDDNIIYCVVNIKSEFNITLRKPKTEAVINNDTIELTTKYPIEFTKGTFTASLDNFQTTLKTNMTKTYDAISSFINMQKENNGALCLSCMYETAKYNNLTFNFYTVSDTEQEITVQDFNYITNLKPYTVAFAIKQEAKK